MGRILFWCAAAALVLLVAAVIATPWIVRAAVPEAFARFGIEASVSGGTLNPLRREVTLEGFILGAPDAPALTLGELGVGLELRALLEGRIKLRRLRVKDVSLNAERLLALRKELATRSASRQTGWPVELDQLALEDVHLVSLGERTGHDVRIERLDARNLSALLADGQSSVALKGSVGEGAVDLQMDVGLAGGKVRAVGTYHLDGVPAGGWPRLADPDVAPIAAGTVTGRGDIHVDYVLDGKKLGVILDGRVGVTGLDVRSEIVEAKDGDASWQGRLALEWSPPQSSPTFRGDGNLEVEKVRLAGGASSKAPFHADVIDVSWHGDFDWRGGFTSQGAVLGTTVEVTDASASEPAWRVHAEDFSSRLHAQAGEASGEFDGRLENVDLARLTATVSEGDVPVDVTAEKVSVDELRGTRSGDIVLGLASMDTLIVTAAAGTEVTTTIRADRLTAKGLSGESSGKLHVAHLGAESLDFERATQRVRVDEIALGSVGFAVPGWVGAGELRVKSVRAQHGEGDVWVSALHATKLQGDAGGSFGAEAVDVEHMFQSGSAALSWEATTLRLRDVHGDIEDAGKAATVDLDVLKIGFHDASWETAGLHASELSAAVDGTVTAAGIDLAKLERRHPGAGDLRVSELGARALRVGEARGVLEGLKAARLEYDTPGGDRFDVHGMEAWDISGALSAGLDAGRFSAARGAGRFVGGGRLSAGAFEVRRLAVATDGGIAAAEAKLGELSHTAADATTITLEDTDVAGLHWFLGGALTANTGALKAARYAGVDGTRWELANFDTDDLRWDGGARIEAPRAEATSASESKGDALRWRADGLHATGFDLALREGIEFTTLAAQSLRGGSRSPAWTMGSVELRGYSSSKARGQSIDAITSGPIVVTDASNGASLDLDRVALENFKRGSLKELSAASLRMESLRLRSSDPDWPSRFTAAELRFANPSRGIDGVADLGEVVARRPYLIVAQSSDNAWMWPPLPGIEGDADKTGLHGGVRVASLITEGPGRVAYFDRATEPAFHLVVDPFVAAIQNFDTSIPGNVARFRARGGGSRYFGTTAQGELRTAVHGFDLSLSADIEGEELSVFNPYLALREPVAFTAGRGDAYTDLDIKNQLLTGEVNLLLSGIELKKTQGGQFFQAIDPASFPIQTALALLKDGQGNISLRIPLKMDTRNPEFDYFDGFQNDFVDTVTTAGKAAANITGKTLGGALQLLEGTVSMLPGVDTARYESIVFAPGSDGLTAYPLVYLDQLGERMEKYPSLELALCGRAVAGDREVVGAPSAGIDALFAEASAGVYPEFATDRKGLLALADARSALVRRYLRESHEIPRARLAACEPELDESPGAKPRVDLDVRTPARRKGLFGIFP